MKRLPIVALIGLLLLVGSASAAITQYNWTDGAYTINKFNGTGSVNWTAPVGITNIEYLIVAGGGAGGEYFGSGGGAGGVLNATNYPVTPLTIYNITVGAGGTRSSAGSGGTSGMNSSISNLSISIVARGGGIGYKGGGDTGTPHGEDGGSGGGGGSATGHTTAKLGTSGQGNNGGDGTASGNFGSGGGGGANATGSSGGANGGNGGDGRLNSITGTLTAYGGGGGGACGDTGGSTVGSGGSGGGGTGARHTLATGSVSSQATNGTNDLGGGGGGGGTSAQTIGTYGGSGVVILRYAATPSLTANFTCTPVAVNTSTTVSCIDYSTGYEPTSWNWSFGDGIYSDLENPAIVYSDNGVYDVNLTVYNATTGYSSLVRSSYIAVSESGADTGWTQQDIQMETAFSFTINFISSTTLLPIPTVLVIDSLGNNVTTTVGTYAGTYNYSTVLFYFVSEGYTTVADSYVIDSDRVVEVQLTPVGAVVNPGGDTNASVQHQVSYGAHLVRFKAVDYTGSPLPDMTVSTVVVESSSPWAWITDILGIDLGTVAIQNTTMNGTTGTDGSVVFLMVETIKYRLDFVDPTLGINEHMFVYPKEDNYEYVFWTEVAPISSDYIDIFFWNRTNTTDPLYMDLGVYYYDSGTSTDRLTFTVLDQDNATIHSETSGSPNNWNISYPVLIERGTAYVWGIQGNSTAYENPIVQSKTIRFGGSPVIFVDFGQPWNSWISIGIIFVIAMLFSRASIKYAAAIVPLLALFFWYVNMLWLPGENGYLIAVIMFFGIIFYIRYAEQESDI